jgi:hypothetical protein
LSIPLIFKLRHYHLEKLIAAVKPLYDTLEGEALLIAVDDFLISRMQHGRVKKVFDQEGILICGGGHVDDSA